VVEGSRPFTTRSAVVWEGAVLSASLSLLVAQPTPNVAGWRTFVKPRLGYGVRRTLRTHGPA
jgi:hypothetical protein